MDYVSLQEIHAWRADAEPRMRLVGRGQGQAMKPLFSRCPAAAPTPPPTRACWRALEREGIPVAGIAGVSGGALVAAAWAGGRRPREARGPGLAPASLDVGARLGRRAALGHAGSGR